MPLDNHIGIFKDAGFTDIRQYQYLDQETQQLNLPGRLQFMVCINWSDSLLATCVILVRH